MRTAEYANKYEDIDKTFRSLSFVLGVKLKNIDIDQQNFWKYQKMLQDAEKEKAEDKNRRPGHEIRRNEYVQKQKEKMRKLGLY